MAGHRKGGKGQSHQNNNNNNNNNNHRGGKASSNNGNNSNQQNTANLSKQQQLQLKVDMQVQELNQTWEDQQPKANRLFSSWNELALAGLVLVALGLLSVVIGVAAGMTISIHYFEDPVHRFDRNGMVLTSQNKETMYDNDIVSNNIITVSRSLDLGRIEKSAFRGERSVVSVVRATVAGVDGNVDVSDDNAAAFRDIFFQAPTIQPSICSDGFNTGFSDWQTLKEAVREANAVSAERFLRWNEYFSSIEPNDFGAFVDDALYYEDEAVFNICPGAILKARKGPIFINSENISIECEDCTIQVGGTHFSFGPHARNIFIRGITFKGAHTSSMAFHHDGADATFEDCLWSSSSTSSAKFGPVADVNSTSVISFHRCEISDIKAAPRGRHNSFGMHNAFSYSMSIRA